MRLTLDVFEGGKSKKIHDHGLLGIFKGKELETKDYHGMFTSA